jgi:branched-chain amino acid transport system substrate-binding protein
VVLGSPDIPAVSAFMKAFEQQHYNPKVFAAASGPDGGQEFLNAVGMGNATGMMVPNGWYGSYANPLSDIMVQEYIARYGGTSSDINTDVAEAYSVGEVAADAVNAVGTNNAQIIKFLHSGVTLNTVQGPAQFDSLGENPRPAAFIFQWQSGANYNQVLPIGAPGSVKILFPKPPWTG